MQKVEKDHKAERAFLRKLYGNSGFQKYFWKHVMDLASGYESILLEPSSTDAMIRNAQGALNVLSMLSRKFAIAHEELKTLNREIKEENGRGAKFRGQFTSRLRSIDPSRFFNPDTNS